jgi:hypothetical protein
MQSNDKPPVVSDTTKNKVAAPALDEAADRQRIHGETAKIAWQELQRFFAQGHAVAVSSELDLVEVAFQMSCDNKAQLEAWMELGHVGVVSDAQALEWLEVNALMWSVVIRPWVLVQPILQDKAK